MTFHPRRNGFLGLSGWEAWRALRRGAGLIQKERIQPPRRSPGRSKWEGRSLRRTEGARTRTTGVALSMHALPDSALPSLGSSDRAAGHCYLDMEPQSRGSTGPHLHSTSRAPRSVLPGLRRCAGGQEAGGTTALPGGLRALMAASGPAVSLLKTRGPRAPPATPPAWPRALPAGAAAQARQLLWAGPSRVWARAGMPGRWDQHTQEGGLSFPRVGPA